jgi:N-acetylglucosamine malate deacetylase 1
MIGTSVKSVLVVAAHADDEALGCGGTMAALSASGCAVRVALMTDGVGARGTDSAEARERRDAAEQANAVLGAQIAYYGDLPDNQLDTVPLLQLVKIVEQLIEAQRPDLVFTHHSGDLNVDHQRVHQAVITACRPQPGHCVRGLLFFEVPSSTEWQPPGSGATFAPNWFGDISATWPRKLAALQAYATEMRAWPHSRSLQAVEHLARWRGASVGVQAAEAFVVGRWIDRR